MIAHVRCSTTLIRIVLLSAGRVDGEVALGPLGLLDGRVHLQGGVVGDDHDDVLGEVLRALALHQDVVDVLLLDCHFESLVHILKVAT